MTCSNFLLSLGVFQSEGVGLGDIDNRDQYLNVRLNMKIYNMVIFSSFIFSFSCSATEQDNIYCGNGSQLDSKEKFSYMPELGFVPNEETAIKIAVAVWEPIYGPKQIAKEKPYKAKLQNGVWVVTGSLKFGRVGGVAEIEICKSTAQVVRLSHGK